LDKYYSCYYYRRKSKKNKANMSVIISIALLLVAFIVIIIFASSNNRSERYSTDIGVSCYLLCAGNFADLSSATILSESIKMKGGAGYIYKNNNYNVIISIYFEDKKAKTVQNTLLDKGETVSIITISLPAVTHGLLEDNENERIKGSIVAVSNTVNTVYEISNGFDTGALSRRAVKQELQKLNEELVNEYEKNNVMEIFKKDKLKVFNEIMFKIAFSINEVMLSDDFQSKDLRFLNIDICVMLTTI